tara:strand:+ start:70 stop:369 length:300 start_codon:yes stop_codon:yes gene_type:complete
MKKLNLKSAVNINLELETLFKTYEKEGEKFSMFNTIKKYENPKRSYTKLSLADLIFIKDTLKTDSGKIVTTYSINVYKYDKKELVEKNMLQINNTKPYD